VSVEPTVNLGRSTHIAPGASLLPTLEEAMPAIVGSLVHVLDVERQETERRRHLAGLVSAVSGQVQTFDHDLARIEMLLEGITVATRNLLAHGSVPDPLPVRYRPRDLREGNGPPDTVLIPRYRQLITMEETIVLPPLDVTWAEIEEEQAKLAPLDRVLRVAMLRSAGDELAVLHGAEATARIREGVPLFWAYVALADGLLINYPGNALYPDGYDAKVRPWFRDTVGTVGPLWGNIYPDASGTGFLLPCNQTILGTKGEFLGVAGTDTSMDRVIEEMSVPGLDGVRESLLVDAEGRVMVSSKEKGVATGLTVMDDTTKERRMLEVPELLERTLAEDTSGFALHEDDLYLFARLKTVPWVLVVRLDAALHGFGA
jgi:hypothetical protein